MLRIARRGPAVLAALGALTLTLVACVQRPALVIETSTGDIVPLQTWTAALSAPSGRMSGTATLSPGVTYRETLASITLSGAAPGALHAWYVQLGECGHDRGILAGLQPYAPVRIDAEGAGSSTVTLPFTVPTNGHFFVSVRQSDAAISSVVACGNLTKERSREGPTIAERAP
jgi:hypothetical protein